MEDAIKRDQIAVARFAPRAIWSRSESPRSAWGGPAPIV
jgi:hypothetical protein